MLSALSTTLLLCLACKVLLIPPGASRALRWPTVQAQNEFPMSCPGLDFAKPLKHMPHGALNWLLDCAFWLASEASDALSDFPAVACRSSDASMIVAVFGISSLGENAILLVLKVN